MISVSHATRPLRSSREHGVEHGVRDLIGDLVGVPLGDGFRAERERAGRHRARKPSGRPRRGRPRTGSVAPATPAPRSDSSGSRFRPDVREPAPVVPARPSMNEDRLGGRRRRGRRSRSRAPTAPSRPGSPRRRRAAVAARKSRIARARRDEQDPVERRPGDPTCLHAPVRGDAVDLERLDLAVEPARAGRRCRSREPRRRLARRA